MHSMQMLSKLLIEQGDIFLAPGNYFHPEFNGLIYIQLPPLLQKQHNQKLIEQYDLQMPSTQTRLLPKALSVHWKKLPIVAVHLGAFLQVQSEFFFGKPPNSKMLQHYFLQPLNPIEVLNNNTESKLIASGAAQILLCLAPFGHAYVQRAKYMFSQQVQQMIPNCHQAILPWNIIEKTCHYLSESTKNETTIAS